MNDVVPLLKFTPSAQDPQVLETITVQREPLIGKLVEAARDAGGGARHQLLIGPRGIGKTHILSLVASRVRAETSDSIALAWLEEDPWAITSYEKFLAAIVAGVAEERSDRDLAERAERLRASGDASGGEAEQVLRDALGESRLVLLVENLNDIFRRIGPNGQERFRALIENWQRMLVLATAPQLFEGVQLHESPFYGFFAITHLDELSLESATELMRRIAELRGDADLVEFLGTDVAAHRLAAIEALAGGHPRIWLLLSGCVSIKAIDDLVPLFLEALDDLTPYYQDRLRELGDQQQELVVLLGEAGGALSNRALAERSGISQNQIATMLRNLTDRGYVRRAEIPDELARGDERMSFWELREPLMRLCLDVKQARGKPLRMVVEFLRAWYGPRLLDELAILPPSARLATTYAGEAFRTLEGSLPADDLFRGSSSEILARAELGLSFSPERSELRIARASALLMEGEFRQALDAFEALMADEGSETARLALGLQIAGAKEALGEPFDADWLAAGLLELGRSEPDDARALNLAATGLATLGRYDEALTLLPRALELNPGNLNVLRHYARSLGETDQPEAALGAFTEVVALEPGNAAIHANRGVALRQLGREEEALEAFETASELNPEKGAYLRLWGRALENLERHDEALAILDRGVEVDPDDARMHGRRGVVLERLGRPEEAREAFARAAELAPDNDFYRERLGVMLYMCGRNDEALVELEHAVELAPDSLAAQSNHGVVLAALGRYEDALGAFQRAVEQDPTAPDLHNNLGAALMNLRRGEEALAAFQRAIDLGIDDAVVYFNLGTVLRTLGRPDEALAALEKGSGLDPPARYLDELRGRLLEESGRYEEALAAVREALDGEPASPQGLNWEANLLRAIGRLDEAEQAIRRAIELDEGEPVYRFTLGEISLTRGDAESALAQLREALAAWGGEGQEAPAGEGELLCRILWEWPDDRMPRRELIEEIVAAYAEAGAGEELGRGLVDSIAWMADSEVSPELAGSWTDDWLAARGVDDLEIPLRLIRAANAWKKDRDRSHLLDLPAEQREILVELLGLAGADAPVRRD